MDTVVNINWYTTDRDTSDTSTNKTRNYAAQGRIPLYATLTFQLGHTPITCTLHDDIPQAAHAQQMVRNSYGRMRIVIHSNSLCQKLPVREPTVTQGINGGSGEGKRAEVLWIS